MNQASRKNLLVLGFEDTLHDRKLITEECVFKKQDHEGMARMLEGLVGNSERVNRLLARQQERRRSGWDTMEEILETRES